MKKWISILALFASATLFGLSSAPVVEDAPDATEAVEVMSDLDMNQIVAGVDILITVEIIDFYDSDGYWIGSLTIITISDE